MLKTEKKGSIRPLTKAFCYEAGYSTGTNIKIDKAINKWLGELEEQYKSVRITNTSMVQRPRSNASNYFYIDTLVSVEVERKDA